LQALVLIVLEGTVEDKRYRGKLKLSYCASTFMLAGKTTPRRLVGKVTNVFLTANLRKTITVNPKTISTMIDNRKWQCGHPN